MRQSTFDRSTLRRGAALVALSASAIVAAVRVGSGTAGPVPEQAHRTESFAASSAQSSPSLAGQVPAFQIDAGPFAGTWHVHTQQLVIYPDGSGTAEWPIHTWCGIGVARVTPPCDRFEGDEIIVGGRAQIQLFAVHGNTAEAIVGRSTDPSELPDGPVTLSLALDDVLTFSTGFGPLCGPEAAALSVLQQQAEGINCGA